ncbi:TraR/DksA C4-type zinc finger protein [Cronobacter dublinensis]|nr:TraR/DksA C4-type zinc finger protein [Cronobacter dublinensis]ALB67192.1 hypothetical protein AFK67_12165 [Cronobacter dublinensis subsp. dublinensis LMG 23823]
MDGLKAIVAIPGATRPKKRKNVIAELIDQANDLVEQNMQVALANVRINRNAVSAEHCAECGEDIPAPRRAAVSGCQT